MKIPRFVENELTKAKSMSTTKIELSRRISHESSSTENDLLVSPGIEINPPLGGSLNISEHTSSTTPKKSKRGSFMQKKFNFFDSKPKKHQNNNEDKLSDLKHQQQRLQNHSASTRMLSSVAGTPTDDTPATTTDSTSSGSTFTPFSNRPNSLDISSVTMPLSTWEGFGTTHHHHQGRFKKMSLGSEDEMSDTYSAPGILEDNKERIDEALREETLLRKRRNSLKLERGQITSKLEALREAENLITNTINNNNNNLNNINKKHLKNHTIEKSPIDMIKDSEKKKEKINTLEQKLHNIDDEMDDIDKRIFSARVLASDDKQWTSTQIRPSSGKSLTRLRHNPKSRAIHDFNSQSIESLSSSVSRESTMSRDTIDSMRSQQHYNHSNGKQFVSKTKSMSTPLKTPDSEEGGLPVSPSPPSQYSGIEELMLTTQRLESSSSNYGDEMASSSSPQSPLSPAGIINTGSFKDSGNLSSPSPIWRSKSMGSMELLKSRPMRMDINQNTTSAKTIIEVSPFS